MRLLVSLFLLVVTSLSFAEQTTQVYDTYLPANKLIPILEPLLGPNDKITGYHNKLFVKAEPATQDELLRVLQELDRPLKNVQISLRYGDNTVIQQQHQAAEVKVFRGSSINKGVDVEVVSKSSMDSHVDNADSQVRVLEGEQGILEIGDEVPIQQITQLGNWQTSTTQHYKTVGHELYVVPKLVEDKIRIEIFTSNQRMKQKQDNTIEKTTAATVLLVAPGEWTPMAGYGRSGTQSGSGGNGSVQAAASSQKFLQIRADIIE